MRILGRILIVCFGLLVVFLVALELLPGKFVGPRMATALSAVLPLELDIALADISIFSPLPEVSLTNVKVSDGQQDLLELGQVRAIAQLSALWTAKPFIKQISADNGKVHVFVNENGELNWPVKEFLLQDKGMTGEQKDSPDSERAERSFELPPVGRLSIDNTKILYNDKANGIDADVDLMVQASTVIEGVDTRFSATGSVNELPLNAELTSDTLAHVFEAPDNHRVAAKLEYGNLQSTLSGSAGFIFDGAVKPQLKFTFEGNDLSDLQQLTGTILPIIPPFSLSGSVVQDGRFIVFRRFDATVGDSTMEGDARVDATAMPVELYANIISRKLDLDDLGGLIGVAPDTTETASTRQEQLSEQAEQRDTLLPDRPIGLAALNSSVVGAVEFEALSIQSTVYPFEDVDMRAELNNYDIDVNIRSIGIAGGQVRGTAHVDIESGVPDTRLDMKIQQVDLRKLMDSIGLKNDGFGSIGGQLKLWAQGDDIATMAANLDGGVFAIMTGGQINSLLAEIAGLDFLESLVLLATPDQETTEIDCAYMDLQSRDGIATLKSFVVDTPDTVFLAEGNVDLKKEQFNLTVEPHPKDASPLSVPTSANIGGSFKSPSILPGKELPLRIAAAAVLGSVAAPLAAILPLVETGTAKGSPYCDGLVGTLDDAR